MSKKNNGLGGLVYSTNPSFLTADDETQIEKETLPIHLQKLSVKLDTKQRAGKVVTLVLGFVGTISDLEELGKMLKTKCGCGGSVKDGIIVIQGDVKQKVITLLQNMNYKIKL